MDAKILYIALLQTLADWDKAEYSSLRGESALTDLHKRAEKRIERAKLAVNEDLCPYCHCFGYCEDYCDKED